MKLFIGIFIMSVLAQPEAKAHHCPQARSLNESFPNKENQSLVKIIPVYNNKSFLLILNFD